MWQELRDYWLPLMLFLATFLLALLLLLLVVVVPLVIGTLPFSHPLVELLAHDTTVRRTCLAGGLGLMVTALVFFRPNAAVLAARKSSSKRPSHDTMAGA